MNRIRIYIFILAMSLAFSAWASDIADMEDILKSYLKDNYPWSDVRIGELKFSPVMPGGTPDKISVEKGPPGKTVFLLEFKDGSRITASGNVKAYEQVIMSRRPLKKGDAIESDDIYVTLLDVTRIPKGAIKGNEDITGKQLSHSIVANMPMVNGMINEGQSVKKGRRVLIFVQSPGFSIKTVGELKERGSVGSYVKAVNLSSKKIVTGLLTDENTVRVEF